MCSVIFCKRKKMVCIVECQNSQVCRFYLFSLNARRVDNNNARTIASLMSLPPVVSGMAITAATMAPSSSVSMTSSLLAGTALRSASTDDGTPPSTSSSAMADEDDDDNNNDGGARGVTSAGSSQPSRADGLHLPPPDRRLFAPTSTVILSSPRGPPGWFVPAPGEVEPSHCWCFFVLPVFVHVRPPPLPSFHPPSPPPPPLAP
jgi:hypothetical protein